MHKIDNINNVICVQDSYMGSEWMELLRDDLTRYVLDESMSSYSIPGCSQNIKTCWIDKDAGSDGGSCNLSINYPAIAELLDNVHSLPYEINSKS